jgi:hypothetical protein
MGCGIPVVSTPLQGMTNYSQGSDTVVYRNLDPSFVEAVADLLADSTKSQILGVAGRNLVTAKGSWQDFVDNFANLAQKVSVTK